MRSETGAILAAGWPVGPGALQSSAPCSAERSLVLGVTTSSEDGGVVSVGHQGPAAAVVRVREQRISRLEQVSGWA